MRPDNCDGARLQEPSLLCVPADNIAPVGTPVTVMFKASDPSVSVCRAVMCKAIAVSSLPAAGCSAKQLVLLEFYGSAVTGDNTTVIQAILHLRLYADPERGGIFV